VLKNKRSKDKTRNLSRFRQEKKVEACGFSQQSSRSSKRDLIGLRKVRLKVNGGGGGGGGGVW
jgi:predicted ATP-grasp superfamily ATP-dependent carboligase